LEMATTNVSEQIDEVIGISEIEMQLEERRQRLGLSGAEAASDESAASSESASGE